MRRANRRTAARGPLRAALDYAQRNGAAPLAAHLFLTVKTVEMHLGRVYRKLGVSSRRELAAVGVTGPG